MLGLRAFRCHLHALGWEQKHCMQFRAEKVHRRPLKGGVGVVCGRKPLCAIYLHRATKRIPRALLLPAHMAATPLSVKVAPLTLAGVLRQTFVGWLHSIDEDGPVVAVAIAPPPDTFLKEVVLAPAPPPPPPVPAPRPHTAVQPNLFLHPNTAAPAPAGGGAAAVMEALPATLCDALQLLRLEGETPYEQIATALAAASNVVCTDADAAWNLEVAKQAAGHLPTETAFKDSAETTGAFFRAIYNGGHGMFKHAIGCDLLVPVTVVVRAPTHRGGATECAIEHFVAKSPEYLIVQQDIFARIHERLATTHTFGANQVRTIAYRYRTPAALTFINSSSATMTEDFIARHPRAAQPLIAAYRSAGVWHTTFADAGNKFKDPTARALAMESLHRSILAVIDASTGR